MGQLASDSHALVGMPSWSLVSASSLHRPPLRPAAPHPAAATPRSQTPRPDGPVPTEQQLNQGPFAGRHVGGWKMKHELLEPQTGPSSTGGDRTASMSNVHGTFFEEKETWKQSHARSKDTPDAATFQERLYPLDRSLKSPWEPESLDMTPMSKTVGGFATKQGGMGATKAAIQPAKKPSPTPPPQPPPMPIDGPKPNIFSVSDSPSWGKQRDGAESEKIPDPAWGYTGHEFAHRFDRGEEDKSMAQRIAIRRRQNLERRFAASPFAYQIAQSLSDSTHNGTKGQKEAIGEVAAYGWGSFPPQGL